MQTSKEAYSLAYQKQTEKEKIALEAEIKEINSIIYHHSRKIIELVSSLEVYKAQLQGFNIDERKEFYKEEFNKLITIPYIDKVYIKDNAIHITTDTIFLYHNNSYTEIGKFHITFSESEKPIMVINFTKDETLRKPGIPLHHPHIYGPENNICFGNIVAGLSQLIGQHEFVIAAHMVIQFLLSFNPKDAYTVDLQSFWKNSISITQLNNVNKNIKKFKLPKETI